MARNHHRRKGVRHLWVLGESYFLIKSLVQGKETQNVNINQMLPRIKELAKEFEDIQYTHVLRSLNTQAYEQYNKGCILMKGICDINGIMDIKSIP